MKQNRRNFLKTLAFAAPIMLVRSAWAETASVKVKAPSVDLDFITSAMDIMPRKQWTEVLPRMWLLKESNGFDRITVHHVGKYANHDVTKSVVVRDLDGILTEHMDRNYGDIGYHFVVDYAGRLWEARSLAYDGAHVSGQNEKNIGIVCMGNFDLQNPSEDQMTTVDQIITVLREHYDIKQTRLFGHRDLGQTACPGDNLYAKVMKLRE